MEDFAKYSDYAFSDFLEDDDFIYWAQYPDKVDQAFWKELAVRYPEKQAAMEAAREMVIALGSMESRISETRQEALWMRIEHKITEIPTSGLRVFMNRWKVAMAAAAVVAVIVVVSINFFLHPNKILKTDYGSRLTVRLPDESVLVLNRNSLVSYSRLWNAKRLREVTMTGEVDFTVKHVATPGEPTAADSFRVNVGDLRVTVLGTAFNIRSRRGKTAISLRTGRLRVDFTKGHQSSILLLPGEQFIYDSAASKNVLQPANVAAAAAWKDNTLILEGTSFADVVSILEDDYGYTVIVDDPTLFNRKLRGSIPMKDINSLYFILEHILDVNVEQQGNTLHITSR